MGDIPAISVLLPIYNGKNSLKQCLLSLLGQSFSNFEIIAIDDGSSDQSFQLLKNFSHFKIRKYKNKENLGLSNTLNRAMRLSRGKFFARMDQDDLCHKERFEKQIKFLRENPRVCMVGTGIRIYDKNRRPRSRFFPKTHHQIKATMIFGSPCAHSTLMFRREIYDQGIRYRAKYDFSEDWRFIYDCSKKYEIHNLKKLLLDYYETDTGIGRKYFKRAYAARKKVARDLLADMGFPKSKIHPDYHLKTSNPMEYKNTELCLVLHQLLQIYKYSRTQTYAKTEIVKKESFYRLLQLMRKARLSQIPLMINTGLQMLRGSE